jgi:hypothetical protein
MYQFSLNQDIEIYTRKKDFSVWYLWIKHIKEWCVQQLFCCVCIRCCRNVFTEPLCCNWAIASNNRGDIDADTGKVGYQQRNCWRQCFLYGSTRSYIKKGQLSAHDCG